MVQGFALNHEFLQVLVILLNIVVSINIETHLFCISLLSFNYVLQKAKHAQHLYTNSSAFDFCCSKQKIADTKFMGRQAI